MTTPPTTVEPFGARLRSAMDDLGPFCPGIDPHPGLLAQWGLEDGVDGLERFAMACVEAFGGEVACVKPQSAFFERFGSRGVAVLERTLEGLRDAGTLALLDAKRGDIGTTMAGYAQAYLSDDSPVRADAVTLSPYLGYESLRPALDLAAATGRGTFVLALTSNPEGPSVQHAGPGRSNGRRRAWSTASPPTTLPRAGRARWAASGWSSAPPSGAPSTTSASTSRRPRRRCSCRDSAPRAEHPDGVRATFGRAVGQVLGTSSREVLGAGPRVADLRAAARRSAEVMAAAAR